MLKTGPLLPAFQNPTLLSKAEEMTMFWFGMKCKAEMPAFCFPISITLEVLISTALMDPSAQPTKIAVLSAFQQQEVRGLLTLTWILDIIEEPYCPWVTS